MERRNAAEQIANLLDRQRRLIEELHELARQEHRCCEADDAERLPEIVSARSSVFQALIDVHGQTVQLARLFDERSWKIPSDVLQVADEGAAIVRRIVELDRQSQSLLQRMTSSRLSALRQMNDGARLLRTYQPRAHAIAHDSRG